MKKVTIVVLAILTLGMVGYHHVADARPWGGGMGGPGCWNCEYWTSQSGEVDEKTIEAREKFLAETVALRKELAVKQAEAEALMNRENPDAKKIATLTGEIFDLRNTLRQKALEKGIKPGQGCGMGMGMGMGHGHGRMKGMGPRAK